MCMFSAPSPQPVPEPAPLPDPNTGEQEEARRKTLLDAKRRKGLGDQDDLSTGSLGSNAEGVAQRPTLLGQAAGGTA